MSLSFRTFLEDEAGVVHTSMMANTAVDDPFKRIRSKYMAGKLPSEPEAFDPEETFGKKKRRCIRCGKKRVSIIRGNKE